ncbi:MAG: DUF5104 domain-containing protein [Oscillospiraceae bacterium]|jgi:hypothetical protein|nr:DUF5104 domain-containing protein [Oscillospiraceae bacterium]
MFNKFIVSILAFLLMLFPNWGGLQFSYQSLSFDMDHNAAVLVDAIESGEITTLEAMMCRNIKENVADLPSEIGRLIAIVDGEIIEFHCQRLGSYEETRNGKHILQNVIAIDVATFYGNYYIGIMWEVANNFDQREIGIRNIGIIVDHEVIARISATERIGDWHG